MTETKALDSKSFCPPSIEAPLSRRLLLFSPAVPLLIYSPIGFILNLYAVFSCFAQFSVLSAWWLLFFIAAPIRVCFSPGHKSHVFSFRLVKFISKLCSILRFLGSLLLGLQFLKMSSEQALPFLLLLTFGISETEEKVLKIFKLSEPILLTGFGNMLPW